MRPYRVKFLHVVLSWICGRTEACLHSSLRHSTGENGTPPTTLPSLSEAVDPRKTTTEWLSHRWGKGYMCSPTQYQRGCTWERQTALAGNKLHRSIHQHLWISRQRPQERSANPTGALAGERSIRVSMPTPLVAASEKADCRAACVLRLSYIYASQSRGANQDTA